ncbi:hypothetical protein AYO49_04560 [Verrucomicrobiaceae bacterium SCGC AG-212-N21]|nr:hypothetical protein AYO49_04560 [Verrucomicrobiaceae bacterium SCGC AG-212-N21]
MILSRCRWALGCTASLFLAGNTPAAETSTPRAPDGVSASLEFEGGTSYSVGELITCTFVVKNNGKETITFTTSGLTFGAPYPMTCRVTAANAAGKELPAENWNGGFFCGSGWCDVTEVRPGSGFRTVLRLQNHVQLNHAGEFRVRASHEVGWKGTPDRSILVADAKITLTEPDTVLAARLVNAAGDRTPKQASDQLGAPSHDTEFRFFYHPVFLPALEFAAAKGQIHAFEGIHRIPNHEATRALIRLLNSDQMEVVHGAALFLTCRMPSRIVNDRERMAWWGGPTFENYNALWLPEASDPLRAAAAKLIASPEIRHQQTAGLVFEYLGKDDDGPLVVNALGAMLKESKVRIDPNSDMQSLPGAGDALVGALAGLRDRGCRVMRTGPGDGYFMAILLEYADPNVPRRKDWEQIVDAFFDQGHPLLTEAAIRALPKPPLTRWRSRLLESLEAKDLGIVRQACITAGESRDPVFVRPLDAIMRTEQNEWVLRSASESLWQIGARWEATDAWIERLADEKVFEAAIRHLTKRLESLDAYGWSGSVPRSKRIDMRERWREFFADQKRRDLVQADKPVPVTRAELRGLCDDVVSWAIKEPEGPTPPK